jgi:hypothetical protein
MPKPPPHPVQRVAEDPCVVTALLRVQLRESVDVAALQLLQRHHSERMPQRVRMALDVHACSFTAPVGVTEDARPRRHR